MKLRLDDIQIYCISLDRRPDRWKKMQEQAAAAGITIQRLSAVDAKSFEAHKHPQVSLLTAHNILFKTRRSHYEIDVPGAVGASLSHIKAWQTLRSSGAPAAIILEDDVGIPTDFRQKLDTLLAEAPAEWDIIQLQKTDYDDVKSCMPIPDQKPWESCDSLMGAFSYMVSQTGAAKLLKRAFPIEMHIDAYIGYMSRLGYIRMIWNPIIDLSPYTRDSDIDHGDCEVCSIPSKMSANGIVALDTKSVVGLMAMAAATGGILALAFFMGGKRR